MDNLPGWGAKGLERTKLLKHLSSARVEQPVWSWQRIIIRGCRFSELQPIAPPDIMLRSYEKLYHLQRSAS